LGIKELILARFIKIARLKIHALIQKSLSQLLILFGVWCLMLGYGCANIVPPDGGPKDETPPVILEMSPKDSLLNTRVSRIDLRFNKFIELRDLEKNMQLSPLLEYNPIVTPNGKRLSIKIADSLLQANTTYRISLGNAIVDNRENTPLGNFSFTFSTGAYFDSLQLKGSVIDAATGLPDTAATIVLYPAAETDSAILRKRPMYVVKANTSGMFTLPSLPQRPFKAYAIYDENNNYFFDVEKEKVAFLEHTVIPTVELDSAGTSLTFYTFRQQVDTLRQDNNIAIDSANLSSDSLQTTIDSVKKPSQDNAPKSRLSARRGQAPKKGYQVLVDTMDIEKRSQEINQPLRINIFSPLSTVDTDKVYLSYDNEGVDVEAIRTVHSDTAGLLLDTRWLSDKVYTLRLVKGWAKDTAGIELPPGKYFFRTKRDDDYGILRIRVNGQYFGSRYLLYVFNDKDSVYLKPITDSTVVLPMLQPATYYMRIIDDANGNGKWDTGDLFSKIQPERVIPFYNQIILKAGWENEIDFLPPELQQRSVRIKEEKPNPDDFEED
jgi:hypothetical protein